MEFALLVNEEPVNLNTASLPSGDGQTIRIGEKECLLRWRSISENELLLDVDGAAVRASLAERDGKAWISIEGESYLVVEAGEDLVRTRRRGGPDGQSRQLTPPMPAAVIRILAVEGDLVKKGQSLIVLSAMKMEMTLTSAYRGMVKKIHFAVGAQVMPGDILMEIEPAEEDQHGI